MFVSMRVARNNLSQWMLHPHIHSRERTATPSTLPPSRPAAAASHYYYHLSLPHTHRLVVKFM